MKEKKEIRITLGTFIVGIIAIILLILVAIMGMYIATMDKKEIQQNTTTTANNNNLDINSELVKKLYSYVDYTFWANLNADTVNDFSKIMYVNGKSTIDTISNDTKLLTVIARMLETGEYTIIKEETLPQVYEEDYGTSLYEYKINDDSYWYNYENKRWEKSKGFDASDESNIVVDDDIKIFNIEAIQKTAKEIFNEELKIEKHSYTFLGEALIYDDDEYKLITY